ncbi:hypothetical protein JHK87_043994 [Glycine soja]|nr:hypothetical protein JHK87_043994 [Glycine soja]
MQFISYYKHRHEQCTLIDLLVRTIVINDFREANTALDVLSKIAMQHMHHHQRL